MKKSLRIIIIVFITSLFLVACTNNEDISDSGSDSQTTNTKTYDLIWWNLFDNKETMQPLIDKYHELNPNVNIRYEQRVSGLATGDLMKNYRSDLEENLNDNEPLDSPDIITIQNTWLGRYQPKLSPSTVITKDQIKDKFYATVERDFVRKNSVYAVPMSMDSLVLIVNSKLMTQMSATDSAGPVNDWFDFQDQ